MNQNKYSFKQLSTVCNENMMKDIAELIYDTDMYIYPALFGCKENAIQIIPELIRLQDEMFRCENIFVAEKDGRVDAIILWYKGPLRWSTDIFINASENCGIPISPFLAYVKEMYFDTYDNIDKDIISIINVCVTEKCRRKGLGKTLLGQFVKLYHDESMELCVLKDNKEAVGLYKRMGFTEVEIYNGFSLQEQKPLCMKMIYAR